jgi:multidrug/hemolysin transport system permease protein
MTKRNIKLFFKDRATLIFTFLAPVIILGLYLLFIRNMQVEGMSESGIPKEKIGNIVDSWLIAGVAAVGMMSVALNVCALSVADRQWGLSDDFLVSPVKPYKIKAAYLLSAFILTFAVGAVFIVLGVSYLALTGGAADVFMAVRLFGVMLLTTVFSVSLMDSIVSAFKTQQASGAFGGLFSAFSGFITGAYMPMSIFPKPVRFICELFPGTHAASLYKQILIGAQTASFGADSYISEALNDALGVKIGLFGAEIGAAGQVVYILAVSVLLVAAAIFLPKAVKNPFVKTDSKNKAKKYRV